MAIRLILVSLAVLAATVGAADIDAVCARLRRTIQEPEWGRTFEDSAGKCIKLARGQSSEHEALARRVRRHQAARQVPLECIPPSERPAEDLWVRIQSYDRDFECTSMSDDIYIPVRANGCTNMDLTSGASIWITVSDGASMGTTKGSTVSWKLYADEDCPQEAELLEGTYIRNRPYPLRGAALCRVSVERMMGIQVTPFFKKCPTNTANPAHPESVCKQSPRVGELEIDSAVGRRRQAAYERATIYTAPFQNPVVQFPRGKPAAGGGSDPTLKLVNENAEFTSIDANKDDKLSQSELRDYLKSQAWVEAGQEATGAASVIGDQGYDTDGDGLINLCEFARGLEADEQKPEVSRLWYLAKNPNANCSVAQWSECHGDCTRTPTITTAQRGSGAACEAQPTCNPGDGQCPRDCEGSWSDCLPRDDGNCARVFNQTVAQHGTGAACPPEPELKCGPGVEQCPRDCAGSWSECDGNCDRVFTETAAQHLTGAACPPEPACLPGEGQCPRDCEGSWSACDVNCMREYSIEVEPLNNGNDCTDSEGGPYSHGETKECDLGTNGCLGMDCKYYNSNLGLNGNRYKCGDTLDPTSADLHAARPSAMTEAGWAEVKKNPNMCHAEWGPWEYTLDRLGDGTFWAMACPGLLSHLKGKCRCGVDHQNNNYKGHGWPNQGQGRRLDICDSQPIVDASWPKDLCPSAPLHQKLESHTDGYQAIPQDVNCVGAWSTCRADCTETYRVTTAKSGNGVACRDSEGNIELDGVTQDCAPGEGACPPDIDCRGAWTTCDADCTQTYTVTEAQSGNGDACTDDEGGLLSDGATKTCLPGEGQCQPHVTSWRGVVTNCASGKWHANGGNFGYRHGSYPRSGAIDPRDGDYMWAAQSNAYTYIRWKWKSGLNDKEFSRSVAGAGFGHPEGVALDKDGNLYMADTSSMRVLRSEPPHTNAGVTRLFKTIFAVKGIAVDTQGNVYVTPKSEARTGLYRWKPEYSDITLSSTHVVSGTEGDTVMAGHNIDLAPDGKIWYLTARSGALYGPSTVKYFDPTRDGNTDAVGVVSGFPTEIQNTGHGPSQRPGTSGMTIDADGNLVLCGHGNNVRIFYKDGAEVKVSGDFHWPFGRCAIAQDGEGGGVILVPSHDQHRFYQATCMP